MHCISRTLGTNFLEDLAVLSQTSVLVSFHGAGQNNILFMERLSSMVEVRPRLFGRKDPHLNVLITPDTCNVARVVFTSQGQCMVDVCRKAYQYFK